MTINYERIGRRIRIARKRKHMSQVDLAALIERSAPYLSHIENGTKILSLDTLISIANALNVSADELLQDHVFNVSALANHAFSSLLHDCNEYEMRILLNTITTLKNTLRDPKSRALLKSYYAEP